MSKVVTFFLSIRTGLTIQKSLLRCLLQLVYTLLGRNLFRDRSFLTSWQVLMPTLPFTYPCALGGGEGNSGKGREYILIPAKQNRKTETKTKSTLASASIPHPPQRHVRQPARPHRKSWATWIVSAKFRGEVGTKASVTGLGHLLTTICIFYTMKWEAALSSRNCV